MPPTTYVLSALSQQPPLCPAQIWYMEPCPHQAVTPMDLGKPCLPRAAHPPSGQQPPKLGPRVSMGHKPWEGGGGVPGELVWWDLGSGTAWLCSSLWTQTSVDDVAACPLSLGGLLLHRPGPSSLLTKPPCQQDPTTLVPGSRWEEARPAWRPGRGPRGPEHLCE